MPVGDGRAERDHHWVRHTYHLAPRWKNRCDGEPMRLVRRGHAYAGWPRNHTRSDHDPCKDKTNNRPHGFSSLEMTVLSFRS